MKNIIKNIIGKIISIVCLNPVGRASLNSDGYAYVPLSALKILKNLEKHVDITKMPEFGELATEIINSNTTCLYYDRLYTIYQSIKKIKTSPCTAEVGVYKGGTSKFIAELESTLSNPEHHCFDTFEGHNEKDISGKDMHKAKQFNDASFDSVKQLLQKYPFVKIYKGRFEDTCDMIVGKNFDFVHIDVDILKPTSHALFFFEERMKKNGIIVVDDYNHKSCPGVKEAVDHFLSTTDGFFAFHLLTGQAILIKL